MPSRVIRSGVFAWALCCSSLHADPLLSPVERTRLVYLKEPTGEHLDRLKEAERRLSTPDTPEPLAKQAYRDGCVAWLGGDIAAARNDWYRARDLNRFFGGLAPDESAENGALLERADGLLAALRPAPAPVVAVEGTPPTDSFPVITTPSPRPHRKGASRPRRPTPKAAAKKAGPIDVSSLVRRAERAADDGQWDVALRYYRRAARLAPERRDLSERVAKVRAEVEGQ